MDRNGRSQGSSKLVPIEEVCHLMLVTFNAEGRKYETPISYPSLKNTSNVKE